MRLLVKIVEPGERILDPFAGSGTTLEAAQVEGYDATGIELSEAYYQVGMSRLVFNCRKRITRQGDCD